MFRRRIPFHQVAMAVIVGVVGGIYVYRPIFHSPDWMRRSSEPNPGGNLEGKAEENVKD
ncbi:protein PIGBOS1 [Brienomyrus brachyistius]|uniref:protein PIGBOS1 n=1 Tax=Brienomyrus brachyistius TaxID=42636 RepID=UPI0020B1E3C7|nr:protein PIGBOS1 [Brienomyrus brachyistius]